MNSDRHQEERFPRIYLRNEEDLKSFARALLPTWEAVDEVMQEATCGRLIGNSHLMAYRDAATDLYDIDNDLTIPFNSMRAGCATNYIPAGGVMTAPAFGHGCVCNYPMFSSLALFHMPGSEAMRPQAVRDSWETKE